MHVSVDILQSDIALHDFGNLLPNLTLTSNIKYSIGYNVSELYLQYSRNLIFWAVHFKFYMLHTVKYFKLSILTQVVVSRAHLRGLKAR